MKRSFLAVALSAVLASSLLTLAPGAATSGLPADYEAFQDCSEVTNTWCEVSFQIDYNGDGTYEDPKPADAVRADVYLFGQAYGYPSMTWDVRRDGMRQELAPNLPEGTAFKIVVNTGDWQPGTSSFSMWKTIGFSTVQVGTDWITTFEAKTQHWNFALNCSIDDCTAPTDQMEYASFGQGILLGNDPTTEWSKLFAGMWVSSNATSTQHPWYDPATMTWHMDLAGPPYTSTLDVNVASFSAFIPDAAALSAYGIDPTALPNQMQVTRTDGTTSTTLAASITHVTTPCQRCSDRYPCNFFHQRHASAASRARCCVCSTVAAAHDLNEVPRPEANDQTQSEAARRCIRQQDPHFRQDCNLHGLQGQICNRLQGCMSQRPQHEDGFVQDNNVVVQEFVIRSMDLSGTRIQRCRRHHVTGSEGADQVGGY